MTPPDEVQFTAIQTWSDGSTRDVTASAQWTSRIRRCSPVSAGFAKALAGGEVGLTVQVGPLTSQPRSVRVVPAMPEWDGRLQADASVGRGLQLRLCRCRLSSGSGPTLRLSGKSH